MDQSNSDQNQAVKQFYEISGKFCSFVDDGSPIQLKDSFKKADYCDRFMKILSELLTSILDVRIDNADKNYDKYEISVEDTRKIVSLFLGIFKDEIGSMLKWHVDHEDEDSGTRVFMINDDLEDLYRDLKNGILCYEIGTEDAQREAVFQWRFGFNTHWGNHLYRLMMTMHEIRYFILFST